MVCTCVCVSVHLHFSADGPQACPDPPGCPWPPTLDQLQRWEPLAGGGGQGSCAPLSCLLFTTFKADFS